jgi:glucokinase
LEEIASGPALIARFNQRRPAAADTGQAVLAAAMAGNPDAADVVRSAGEALGSSVGMLVSVLDPEAVVVGGGLGLSEGPYWDSLVASTRRHIWSQTHRNLPILHAATGSDAGVIGAAAAAWKKLS